MSTRRAANGLLTALGCLITACALGLANAQESALTSPDQRAYMEGLKRLYLANDDRAALLAHTNALLNAYALKAGYQVGQKQPRDFRYEVRLGAPGELIIREEVRTEGAVEMAVRNRHLSVFGVDPFVQYACPASGISCTFVTPGSRETLFTVLRDQAGADQLAKALSLLIRDVQRG